MNGTICLDNNKCTTCMEERDIGGEAKRKLGNFKPLNLISVTCNSCGLSRKTGCKIKKKKNLSCPREQGNWKEHSATGKANFLAGAGGNMIQYMKKLCETVSCSTRKLDTVTPAVPSIVITIVFF